MLKAPSWATTGLALLAGLLAVLNETTFGFPHPWKVVFAIAIPFIAGLGISPLTGPAFRNALHISQNANVVITSAIGAATIAVTTISMSGTLRDALLAALAILAGLGFGTVPAPVPAQAT